MKFTEKQKEHERIHGYTIMTVENKIYKVSKDKKPVLASDEEIVVFHYFVPPTLRGELRRDIKNFHDILKNWHRMNKRWQAKLICEGKSKLNNGRKYYVLEDFNGEYHTINREGIKMLKNKGLISKAINSVNLSVEAIYVSKNKKK